MMYRTHDEGDRIQYLWVVVLPNQVASDLAMPTGSQRDQSLVGQGTPDDAGGDVGSSSHDPNKRTELEYARLLRSLMQRRSQILLLRPLPLPMIYRMAMVSTFDASTGQSCSSKGTQLSSAVLTIPRADSLAVTIRMVG